MKSIVLTSSSSLTKQVLNLKIKTWEELLLYIKNIPYGRNANREDLSLVIKENKGTCSSKHAFLKQIANENNVPNVELIIGIYKMNEFNTNIGKILTNNNLEFIPEAHCYLKINGKQVDCTTKDSEFEKIKNDLIEEIEIEPFQVGEFKIQYHKKHLKKWLLESNSEFTFDQIWSIRELCIDYLSNKYLQYDNNKNSRSS